MPIAILLSVIAYQILYIFVHMSVYATIVTAFNLPDSEMILKAIFLVLSVSFTATTFLAFRFKNRLISWAYAAAAYWFGLINFLFAGAVMWLFTENILNHFVIYVSPGLLGAIAFGVSFLIHLYGTWNARRAQITKISVSLPGLPEAWKGKKFVFVSDVHLGNVQMSGFARKVTRKIMALQPEAIFIGGDMYDGGACDPDKLIAPMSELKAPKGVYFISGNHEFYVRNFETAFEAIKKIGIRILHNETVDIDGIEIVGIDYRSSHKKEDFEKTLREMNITKANKTKPRIMLKHEPELVNLPVAEEAGISLAFFGHTHKGQIFPLNYITKQIYGGYDYGLKPHGDMQVYTSSGAGTWGPPLRIGTRSEIVLVELK